MDKHKARLVGKGFSQVEGIDYTQTLSLVTKMNSIRRALPLVASFKWEVHQMDVKSAFLHGDLHEKIYMEQPLALSKATLALFVALGSLSMVSNKQLGFGMPKWIAFS